MSIDALADPELVEVLRWMFDRQLHSGEPQPDGRVAVTISGPRLEVLAAQIAGFGRGVEVVGPPEARAHLARIAAELTSIYAG